MWIRRRRQLPGARLLPFVEDSALFTKSFAPAMELKDDTFVLLDDLGLDIHPTKRYHTATHVGDRFGIMIDMEKSEFRAPNTKLNSIAALVKQLLVRAAQNKRWVPDKSVASLARKARFLLMATPVAGLYLGELDGVIKAAESWTWTTRVRKQLKRDLAWRRRVPEKYNGALIFKTVETANLYCDSSGFGWGALLNDCIEARGFWSGEDR
jgi:hypothetical protein